jgi:hypothetical protein
MAKVEQMELFRKNKPHPRPMREAASLEMRGPEKTFETEVVGETKGPHVCVRCEQVIPKGSKAVRVIPIENGRKNYEKIDYFHLKTECPEMNK